MGSGWRKLYFGEKSRKNEETGKISGNLCFEIV